MTHDDTHNRITRARTAARLSRAGSLAGALGVVMLALGVVGFITGRYALSAIAVVIAVGLFVMTTVGMRVNAGVRRDPAVQHRSSRLRRARYRDAYPPQQHLTSDDHAAGS